MAVTAIHLPPTSCSSFTFAGKAYSRAHKYRSDQEHVRASTLTRSASLCLSGGPSDAVSQPTYLSVYGFTGAESAYSAFVASVKVTGL